MKAAFVEAVHRMVQNVPPGTVATYGQIARLIGYPRHARHVGKVLYQLRDSDEVPWHRVINGQGRLSTYKVGSGELQRFLLEQEGIVFVGDRCHLDTYGWTPDPCLSPAPDKPDKGKD